MLHDSLFDRHRREAPVVARTVARVETRVHAGPDAQVDDRNVVFGPTRPARTDPFLLLSEEWFSTPGFEWHPHRGVETVTTVLDGVLEHGDSLGNRGAFDVGDVQWMTSGRGIVHRELAYRNERAHTLQLWVNMPAEAKFAERRYQDLLAADRPRVARDGASYDLVSGAIDGTEGPAANHWPISGAVVTVEPGRGTTHELPATDRAFVYVLSGRMRVQGVRVQTGQTAWTDPVGTAAQTSMLRLEAPDGDTPAVAIIYSGAPIAEHIEIGGGFVMNSRAEIAHAFSDYRNGKFGEIPRQARLAQR